MTATTAKTEGSAEEAKSLDLSALAPIPGSRKKRKRKGIGEGSGNGKTAGKGGKGQSMRSGYSLPRGFEGGQMPMYRRLPKVGFTSRKKLSGVNDFSVIALEQLNQFADGSAVSIAALREKGLVRGSRSPVKILGGGELIKKLNVEANAFSSSAKEAIEKRGGTATVVAL